MVERNKGRLIGIVPTRSKDGYCISRGREVRLPGKNITVRHDSLTRPVSTPCTPRHIIIQKINP